MFSLSNLSWLVALSLLAVFVVVLIVSTLGAPFGLEAVHSPLLITLTANILVTEIIAIFTAIIADRDNHAQAQRAQKQAATTFIFANALSALAVLTNSFMETVELRKVTAENGLSLLLDVWILREDALFVEVYRNVLGGIMLVALVVALRGAVLFTTKESSHSEPPVPSIFLSLVLMILGALIGTHWQEVPFESRQIMGTWGSIVTWGTALAILVFTLVAALAITLATIRAISLSIFGVVREGRSIVGNGISFILGLVSWEVFKGTLLGALLILGLMALNNVATFLVVSLINTAPEADLNSIGAGLERLNSQSLPLIRKCVFYLAPVALLGIILGLLAPSASKAAMAMFKFCRNLWMRILLVLRSALEIASEVRFTNIDLNLPTRAQLFFTASVLANGVRAAMSRISSINFQTWAPVLIACSLISSSSLAAEQYIDRTDDRKVGENSESTNAARPPKSDPFLGRLIDALNNTLENSKDDDPIVKPKIGWEIQALRVCDTVYVAPEWQMGSSEDLELPLFSCRLSDTARQSEGILVVVGAASYESGAARTKREIARAKERGTALADWAADQVSPSQKILVLNLGVAKSATRRRPENSVLASLIYDRPATAFLLSPPDSEDAFSEEEALWRLQELLNEERFLDDFTNCELFGFDRLERELDLQPQFICDALD